MKFLIKETMNSNIIVKNSDYSFRCNNSNKTWNFQVMLDDSGRFMLNFDLTSHKCISCEGFIHKTKKINIMNLIIPQCLVGGLFIEDIKGLKIGIEYMNIDKTMFYDENNGIFAIGNNETKHQFYMFGIGQYVAIDENNNIVCAMVKFYNQDE